MTGHLMVTQQTSRNEKFHGHVLLVEDEPEIKDMMLRRLKRFGVTVDAAEDHNVAIERLKERRYDLVICDFNISHAGSWKNGGYILRSARELYPDMPFYFVSGLFGMLKPEWQDRFLEQASGYIPKPITIEQLQEMLAKHLKKALQSEG